MGHFSDFLFARPSFMEGMARVIDPAGLLNEYNIAPTGELADYYAILADWSAVGCHLRNATEAEHSRTQAGVAVGKAK